MNPLQTYLLLSQCLSLDFVESHRQSVLTAFGSRKVEAEKFVKTADTNLVLQSVYPQLEKHELVPYLPWEIADHLKMIFELNVARNKEILKQIASINNLLSSENIYPLYLKGAGNILDGLYSNPGERILHDIDLLVEQKDFDKTVELFLNNGYRTNPFNQTEIIKSSKHYPILFNENFPACVEIHRIPVINEFAKILSVEMVFRKKITPALMTECNVMCNEHKVIHTFIHSQLEDKGHYYAKVFLRSLYDLLLLSKRVNLEEVFSGFSHYQRKFAGFTDIMYKSFGIKPSNPSTPKIYFHFYSARYFLNIRSKPVNSFSTLFLRMFLSYVKNPLSAITYPEIRQILIKKLKDRNWYGRHFGRYGRLFKKF